jgi:hypothetical protein
VRPAARREALLQIADRCPKRAATSCVRAARTSDRKDATAPFHPDGGMRPEAGRWIVVGVRAPATRAPWELIMQPISK